ncbi:MAG: DUF4091 domain-containing protein [Kiritimatiellae bacterium]|nr:DUF4091 domain-containing protein [Kiritimatiellia bacterium]
MKPISSRRRGRFLAAAALCAAAALSPRIAAAANPALPEIGGWPGIVEKEGTGTGDDRWFSDPLDLEPNATYALSFDWARDGGSAGLGVAGSDAVNVDLKPVRKGWIHECFAFRTRAGAKGGAERIHFGQWHATGTLSYKSPRLEKVHPVYERGADGTELGAGEWIEGHDYKFETGFRGFGKNDCRPFDWATNAWFNNVGWVLNTKSELRWEHKVTGRRFVSATAKITCNWYDGGPMFAEASRDGKSWVPIGKVDSVGPHELPVPASVFPAETLRFRWHVSPKNTALHVISYSLDAKLQGPPASMHGVTRYISDADGRDVGGSTRNPYFDEDYGELVGGDRAIALWRASSGRKIPPGRHPPAKRAGGVAIRTAANEAEAVQLVVTPGVDLSDARVKPVGDLDGPGGARIPISAIDILRVGYVKVDVATDNLGLRALWPDPLPPQDQAPLPVAARHSQPFWIRAKPPKGTPKGLYRGRLLVECTPRDGGVRRFEVPFGVEVFGFEMPDEMTCKSHFSGNMNYPWKWHFAKTPAEKAMVSDRYLDALAACHMSPGDPTGGMAHRKTTWNGNKPVFDWKEWDDAMERSLARRHFNTFTVPVEGLGGGSFHRRVEPSIHGVPGTNEQYHAIMADYAGRIERHLREKGWLDKAFVYWFDEPDEKDYEFVAEGMRTLKRHAPGLRRFITEHAAPQLTGLVNIWCPGLSHYSSERAMERRAAGDEVWWYVCTGPKAPYCGLFIDHPANEMRIWLWQTWKEGVTGILVWHPFYWTSPEAYPDDPQNPYLDPMSWCTSYDTQRGQKAPWGNGDGRFFYPPLAIADGKSQRFVDAPPVSSFRAEAIRDGIEDYEYFTMLWMLDPLNPLLEVPPEVTRSRTEFSADPEPLEKHRLKLAREIERLSAR